MTSISDPERAPLLHDDHDQPTVTTLVNGEEGRASESQNANPGSVNERSTDALMYWVAVVSVRVGACLRANRSFNLRSDRFAREGSSNRTYQNMTLTLSRPCGPFGLL